MSLGMVVCEDPDNISQDVWLSADHFSGENSDFIIYSKALRTQKKDKRITVLKTSFNKGAILIL